MRPVGWILLPDHAEIKGMRAPPALTFLIDGPLPVEDEGRAERAGKIHLARSLQRPPFLLGKHVLEQRFGPRLGIQPGHPAEQPHPTRISGTTITSLSGLRRLLWVICFFVVRSRARCPARR